MRCAIALAPALAICPAAALPAAAQTPGNSGTGSQLVMFDASTPAYVAPQVEHLLGDLGGVRSDLENRGIYLRFNAIAEFAGNIGGAQQGATSANQLGFSADIDWQRLAGITGLSTHVIFVNRSGANDSHLFGDNVSPVQEIFGAGGDVAVHLVSAYAEETMFSNRVDIAAGWMNVENDFASSPLYCNYMNNALCGDPKALPGGDIGHSAFPDAVWAGRIRVRPTSDTYITTGVYEVNQDLYSQADSSGFEFGVPRDSGVYIPVQLGYEPKLGEDQMLGHYVIGFGYDTSRFKSFSSALPASAGVPASTHNGNEQVLGARGSNAGAQWPRRPGRPHRARRLRQQQCQQLKLCAAIYRRSARLWLLARAAEGWRRAFVHLLRGERRPRQGSGRAIGTGHPNQQFRDWDSNQRNDR